MIKNLGVCMFVVFWLSAEDKYSWMSSADGVEESTAIFAQFPEAKYNFF